MASPKLLFCLSFVFLQKVAEMTNLFSSVHRERSIISASVGSNVTLKCFFKADAIARCFWYKQPLGQKPRLMSTFIMSKENVLFHGEWSNNPRFTLHDENGTSLLIISDLEITDSAAYICACSSSISFEFAEGTVVSVKGSEANVSALIYQSASETIQHGASVTLSCTTHTGTCDGGHSVYWFKKSEKSYPGLIYTHDARNDRCEREPQTGTSTCVHNFAMESIDRSHVGTYYCAVVSCGHILFGNGTRINLKDDSPVLVYLLSGALTFTTIVSSVLALILLVNKKNKNSQCSESSASSTVNAEGNVNEDNLHYAALRVNRASMKRSQRHDTENECVYSVVQK